MTVITVVASHLVTAAIRDIFFFFNDTATTEIYTLSLHDALPISDELAGTFGVKEGVLVAEVMKGGPAEAAGVRQGDVIVELNGAPIKEVPELQRRVAAVAPGQPVRLKVIRERKPVALSVTVTEMPAEEPVLAGAPDEESWGLGVEPLSGEAAAQLGLTIAGGLLVTDVVTGGPADRAGLPRGDVIVQVGQKP